MKTSLLPKQNGAALIVSLVILVLMTLLGLSSIRTSALEEKWQPIFEIRNWHFKLLKLP